MDVNATVDIGKNLTSLVERLAEHIGTTADKVFPWYVHQAQLEGVTTLIGFGIIFAVLIPVCTFAAIRACKTGSEPACAVTGITGVALAFALVIGLVEGSDAVRKVYNPNYYAMKMLTRDIGRLTAR